MTLNPYQSPKSSNARARHTTSVFRGIISAIPLAALGYLLPTLAFSGFDLIRYGEHAFQDGFVADIINSHKRMTWDDLKYIAPNLGCMLLFALSGFVNFTPRQFPGLFRTMIRIGLAAVVGVFVSGIIATIFGLTTRSYTDEYAPIRFAIFSVVPVAYALWLLNGHVESSAEIPCEPSRGAKKMN